VTGRGDRTRDEVTDETSPSQKRRFCHSLAVPRSPFTRDPSSQLLLIPPFAKNAKDGAPDPLWQARSTRLFHSICPWFSSPWVSHRLMGTRLKPCPSRTEFLTRALIVVRLPRWILLQKVLRRETNRDRRIGEGALRVVEAVGKVIRV